ncbi:uncharacterized protein C3orf85-like [Clarias gariepinus]|uniref:uncharacterized protein C3orf85-like n=1 Tax=Clarias gariepinus TaxID=13013 RepID=UPI00234C1AA1|nr:uncharacterized protein C3orf85-like [Clarias gariepinus]
MMRVVLVMLLLGGVFAAPFLIPEHAKRFIRQKRQINHWDPSHSQNVWGYTVQEQVNEYWTALRTDIQYYMDMGNLVFNPAVADENYRMYMEMLRNERAHLDTITGRQQ